jgi:hypothetical protein
MRRTLGAIASATGGTLIAVLLIATPAMGGQFTVATCQADRLGHTSSAFLARSTSGMQVVRACDPVGRGVRGLVTSDAAGAGTVPRGAASLAVILAAPGTSFTHVDWAGLTTRSDCGYTLQVYADSPGGKVTAIGDDVRANQRCSTKARNTTIKYQYQAREGNPFRFEPRATDLSGATRIVQRVICEGTPRHAACSTRGGNYISTFHAAMNITDDQLPTATITPDTPLANGAWVNGSQPLHYDAQDNVGVKAAQAMVGDAEGGSDSRACHFATPEGAFADPIPCPNGTGQITVEAQRLPEGTHQLVVQASDAAGNLNRSEPVTARIDKAPPPRVDLLIDGGGEWRNRKDFTLSWVNPPEPDRAPIAAATYKLCPTAGGDCKPAEQTGDNVASLTMQVPAPGEWTVSMWRRDAAGNEDPNTASVPVTLRYDPEPPLLGFEPSTTDDPTLVSVQVTDKVSGLAGGSIEIGPAGSNTWQTLETRKEGNRLVARIDDATLAAGDYVLRASAYDQAHNEASTTQRLDGEQMTLALPVRAASAMQVGVPYKRTVRKTIQRHGKRHIVRRRVTVLRPATSVVFGRRIEISGRLTNRDGQGIPDAEVQVLSRSEASPEQLDDLLRTDAAGNYRYSATGNASRVLRFAYRGSEMILPAQSEVRLEVPARSSLHASPRQVLSEQPVRFSGRVRTLPIPEGGKLVELQVRLPKHWQTFRTARTDQAGRWDLKYAFNHAADFQLRILLAHEAGYPFADGRSGVIHVQVRGQ